MLQLLFFSLPASYPTLLHNTGAHFRIFNYCLMILFLSDLKYCVYIGGSMLIMNQQGIQHRKTTESGWEKKKNTNERGRQSKCNVLEE